MNTVIINGVNITDENERLKIELNELKKDVARYLEERNRLKNTLVSTKELAELWALEEKLSKVGNKK